MNTDVRDPRLGTRHEFRFVASPRPLILGSVGAVALLAGIFGWAWWSGRGKNLGATEAGVMIVSAGLAITFVILLRWRSARAAASGLGHIELDDDGIRWRHGNDTLGFDAAWNEVERGIVEARDSILVLFRREAKPIVIGVLSQHGIPAGLVVPERFGEIVELVGRKVPTSPHAGSGNVEAGRRTLVLGASMCVTAVVLYAANVGIGSLLGGTRLLAPIPAFVGLVGLLFLFAGARVRAGKGALVSPVQGPRYRAQVVRFLVVASVANFALVALVNGLAHLR